MKSKLTFFLVLLVFVCSVTVFAEGKAETAEGEIEQKSITIQYQPNPLFAALSVPLEKGWFEEEGFEKVEIKNFSSGNLAGEAVISGDLSIWVPGNMPIISMRHNGRPIVVTGNLNVCPAEYLMVRNDAGVSSPEDLYNIKIGLLQGSTASGVIEDLAMDLGLDPAKLQIVNLPPPEQVTAMRNNEIQALLCWPPTPLKVEDIATYMFDSKKYSHTRVPMVFGADYIKKYPNTAKAIMRVLYRGQEFCMDKANWPEAKKIHSARSEQPMDLVEAMWLDYWDLSRNHGAIDQRFVEDFEAYTAFQERNGMIDDPIHVLDYTYTGFLEEIDPDLVEVEGRWEP
jgi:taurine transport system substrate-binding protein